MMTLEAEAKATTAVAVIGPMREGLLASASDDPDETAKASLTAKIEG